MNDELSEALRTIHGSLERSPALAGAYYAHWRHPEPSEALDDAARAAADLVDDRLPEWTATSGREAFAAALGEPTANVLLIWCDASSASQDARLATLLKVASEAWRDHARIVARNRVVEGPLEDALPCAPLLGPGEELGAPENREALARMEVLIWEAGARALEVPELGPWLWDRETTFEAVVGRPARGSLRGRVLAARCLEIAVCGMPMMTDPALVGRTLQVMQPLLLHPEPLVWIHAARAFGRLAGTFEPLEGTLLDWVHGATPVLRQRAMTAFASLPSRRLAFLGHELESVIEAPENEAWVLAAAAAATPYLFHERRDLWNRLSARIMRGDGGAVAARALGRGLATLWRRGHDRDAIRPTFRKLRRRARRARADAVDDWRRWLELVSVTDPLDAAERDPLDVELGLENLVRVAAEYDDEEADARAARFASTLATSFAEARRVVLGEGSVRHRAAAMNAFEGCARSLALRLWDPLLATRPGDRAAPVDEPELEETWNLVARAPAELLEIVRTRRAASEGDDDEAFTLALEVLAIKLGGYALDACGEREASEGGLGAEERRELGPGPGQTAHDTCLWLRKLDGLVPPAESSIRGSAALDADLARRPPRIGSGLSFVGAANDLHADHPRQPGTNFRPGVLVDGSRELPPALGNALSALFWRLVDTTRGTSLGEIDDVAWLGPFAAWWALVIDRPAILQQLANALPMIADGALDTCCSLADATRAAVARGEANGAWAPAALEALEALHAGQTELAQGLTGLAAALERFASTSGPKPDLEAHCIDLVLAAERLQAALADPVRGLRPGETDPRDDSLTRVSTENAPRMATIVARAVRAREPALLDVWFASLGPATSALVEAAVEGAISRTPPPPPVPKRREPQMIVGYELVKALGEGGIGSVWLVRKPGADRLFVLKIPKADALANATETERAGILASFKDEAQALAGLYHPNVASIIDRGVTQDVPFLVLEYLIGADLKDYSSAKLMSLYELRHVVVDCCAGLTALHNAGLVHRDIKPANIWLRLPLAGGQRFEPDAHRDPGKVTPLNTVLIDFGMVRAMRVPPDVGGRFVAGTPGYIAPEQVLDPVELDGRADVYAMAGTIYNVTTGRAFFDDIDQPRERIMAHMRQDPMEDAERFRSYPAALVKLLRAATARDWKDRPTPLELAREFEAAI